MTNIWNNIDCDHKVQKIEQAGRTDFIHQYDFGLFDFDEAARLFGRFSFEAKKVMKKIKDGKLIGSGFTGGQHDELNFHAIREGDMVYVTMTKTNTLYKQMKSKMI